MKVYIETYGCSANLADTNIMKTLLLKAGYQLVDSIHEAGAVILNTCIVRSESERKMVQKLIELEKLRRKLKFKLIVTGCMAKARPALIAKIAPEASMIAPQLIEDIVDVISSPKRIVKLIGEKRTMLPKYMDGIKFTVPIAEGCLGNCSYCIVRIARGRLRSYPVEKIVEAVKCAVRDGAKEIRLTAQDTSVYGLDIGRTLPELVREVAEIPGDFMIRIGMMTPNGALKIIDELMEVYEHPKVYKFFHIPVQSGDDRILKLMRRKYTSRDFIELAETFRRKFPEGFIATDIIVGFPTEDEEAFQNTIELLKKVEPDKVHVSRYTPRPHTEAASMPQIPEHIKKKRSRIVASLSMKIGLKRNKPYIGRIERALITDPGRRNTVKARLENYRLVVLKAEENAIGKWVKVKIVNATPIQLIGELTT